MTRVKISICLLAVLTAAGIFSGIWINKRCDSLSERAMAVCEAYKNGNITAAVCEAELLEEEWEDMRKKAALMLKYDRLSEIDGIASHASLITAERYEDVIPKMAELIRMLEILSEGETPCFGTVF